jgi:hypothetical protein
MKMAKKRFPLSSSSLAHPPAQAMLLITFKGFYASLLGCAPPTFPFLLSSLFSRPPSDLGKSIHGRMNVGQLQKA